MRYFLDELEIQSPVGLDGLTLRKGISRRYWGFLYRKLGYVEGLSDLLFEQPEAIRLLQQQLARFGVNAQTRFRIVAGSGLSLYDGFVNYGSYKWDGSAVSVALQDDPAVVNLETQAATAFALTPGTTLSLHARRLNGLVQLLTDPGTLVLQRSTKDPATLSHSLPLTRKAETDDTVRGTLAPVVTPLALDPLYRNTTDTDQLIKLNGQVRVTAEAGSAATVRLLATALDSAGTVRSELELGQFGVSTSTVGRFLVDVRIAVPVDGSLRLWWKSTDLVSSWKFTYDAPGVVGGTLISLTDEVDLSGSTGTGILVVDALRELVFRASGGRLSFRSRLFESGEGYGLFLLNSAGLRGDVSPITTTLQDVFEGLNSIWNLSLWQENGVVWIESKADAPTKKTVIRQAFGYSQQVATEYLYSQIQIGYQTWAGSSLLAGEEINGSRIYTTGVTSLTNALDIRSALVASSTLIEEGRRADAKSDALYLICAVGGPGRWQAETSQQAGYATGVTDPDTLYNRRISPRRNLHRWQDSLRGSLPVKLESSAGGDGLTDTYNGLALSESSGLSGPPTVPMLTTTEVPMTLDQYNQLGDWIELQVPGLTASGKLLDAQWRNGAQGETATLQFLTQ